MKIDYTVLRKGISASVLASSLALTPAFAADNMPSEIKPLSSKSLLLDIQDVGGRMIAVGERGHVVASIDGENWVQVETPTRATLNAVHFVDPVNGWAVGHDAVILRTNDGGQSWSSQQFEPGFEKPLMDVYFMDTQRGLAIGAYSLMQETNDGGRTWSEVDTPIREDEWHFNAITRLNDGSILIVGESGTLARSTDGARTWESLESPYESSFFGALPRGPRGAVIYGLRGNAYYTDDISGGEWERLETNTNASLTGGAVLSGGEIVLVGLNGTILKSTAGVSRVKPVPNPDGKHLSSVAIVGGSNLMIVGESGVSMLGQ